MNIKQELTENQTILLTMPSIDYNTSIVDIIKQLEGNVCYVTLNKTFESLKALFEKKNIDLKNVVFIDAISKTIRSAPKQANNVYFISSPGALTEISLAISKFLKHGFDYIIFDSLTNLLVYERKAPVSKFVSSLVNKVKESKTKAIFYALSIEAQQSTIKESGMFVDKVIEWK